MDTNEANQTTSHSPLDPVGISAKSVIEDLHSGVTRCEGDNKYDPERGSIQEKYGLTKTEVAELFQHPLLKGLKVRVPKKQKFVVIDDVTETPETTQTEEQTTTTETEVAIETTNTEATATESSIGIDTAVDL